MNGLPLDTRSSEIPGEFALWQLENAETNSENINLLKKALRGAVQRELTPLQRETLLTYYCEGLSMAEIAARQGVNRSTVSRSITRSRERLKRVLRYYL